MSGPNDVCCTCGHARELHPLNGACAHLFGCGVVCRKFWEPTRGTMVECCKKTPKCAWVDGHLGDCRIKESGEGDLTGEIRLKVALDAESKRVRELEAALESQARGLPGEHSVLVTCWHCAGRGSVSEDVLSRVIVVRCSVCKGHRVVRVEYRPGALCVYSTSESFDTSPGSRAF